MHDLLEGICKFDMAFLYTKFILNNLFFKGSLLYDLETGLQQFLNVLEFEMLKRFLQFKSIDSDAKCLWVSIKKTKYKPKLVFTLDVYENDLLIFEVIDEIILYNNTLVILSVYVLILILIYNIILIFDDHVFSYEVK